MAAARSALVRQSLVVPINSPAQTDTIIGVSFELNDGAGRTPVARLVGQAEGAFTASGPSRNNLPFVVTAYAAFLFLRLLPPRESFLSFYMGFRE